jgi:hypothetical protein
MEPIRTWDRKRSTGVHSKTNHLRKKPTEYQVQPKVSIKGAGVAVHRPGVAVHRPAPGKM